jgi:translocation protein SEC62
MRQGVYYLSLGVLGLLGAFMGLAVVRFIIYIFTVLFMGKGGWLYPNLFADVGVIESFTPLWVYVFLSLLHLHLLSSWEKEKKKKKADGKAKESDDEN